MGCEPLGFKLNLFDGECLVLGIDVLLLELFFPLYGILCAWIKALNMRGLSLALLGLLVMCILKG